MLRRSAALLSLCSIILLGDSAFAQQNLFNVPNGEITKPGHFFTQQQFNLTRSALQSNSTLDYGLGDGWEAGLNLFFLNFSNASPTEILTNVSEDLLPAEPLLMANFQKGWQPAAQVRLSAGAQGGTNPGSGSNLVPAALGYATLALVEPVKGLNLHGGIYAGTATYNGSGSGFLMGGFEFAVVKEKLHLLMDFVHGNHANAVIVTGLAVYVTDRLVFSAGWQKPFPGSRTEEGVVMELTAL